MNWKFITVENNQLTGEIPCTVAAIEQLDRKKYIASVPGDFVSDMVAAGDLPDYFYSENILQARKLENLHIFYYTEIKAKADDYLYFEGIDTVADIYVNGEKVKSTDNMFIGVEVRPRWREGINSVVVHIKPVCLEARKRETPSSSVAPYYFEQALYMRKTISSFGWDILPRMLTAGIYKPVRLLKRKKDAINDVFAITGSIQKEKNTARVRFYFGLSLQGDFNSDYTIKVVGKCGESTFEKESIVWHTSHSFYADIPNAKLWWPHNYGEPNLYDIHVDLYYKGKLVDTYEFSYGIRTSRLEYSEKKFQFYVNEEPIFAMGTNWVPTSIFSGDTSRLTPSLELLKESGANMVRVWGGGNYEDDKFYNFCDQNGIMVWQDFMMACSIYPQDDAFCKILEEEATYQVKRLRNHASIVLWCGDNECDLCMESWSDFTRDPASNVLTRKVLPRVLSVYDHSRTYLPSSPYLYGSYADKDLIEWHLWTRDAHFASPFFLQTAARFVSEIGYTAFPSMTSLKKFIKNPENVLLEDGTATDEYILHGTAPDLEKNTWYDHKVPCTCRYAEMTFGKRPENFELFIKQSQYTQAEAYKTWVETARVQEWSGILLWNLVEGWPGISEAMVDYYFDKKPSFGFVKNAQKPVSVIISEESKGKLNVYIVNAGKENAEVSYTIQCGDKLVGKGGGEIAAHEKLFKESIETNGESNFYTLVFTINGEKHISHYQENPRDLDIQTYLDNIQKTYGKI